MKDKLGKLIEKQKNLKKQIKQARADQRKREQEALLQRQDRLFSLIRKFEEDGWPMNYEVLKNELRAAIGYSTIQERHGEQVRSVLFDRRP